MVHFNYCIVPQCTTVLSSDLPDCGNLVFRGDLRVSLSSSPLWGSQTPLYIWGGCWVREKAPLQRQIWASFWLRMGAQDVSLPTPQGLVAFASSLLPVLWAGRRVICPSLAADGLCFTPSPSSLGVRVCISSLRVAEGLCSIWEKDSGAYPELHACQLSVAECLLCAWATKGDYVWFAPLFLLSPRLRPEEKIWQVRAAQLAPGASSYSELVL